MAHLRQLSGCRRIELRHVVAMDGAPPGGHSVHQAPPIFQMQTTALCGAHGPHARRLHHGGVGMPQVLLIDGQI